MSAAAVVGHLRDLAADPTNRGTIVKDQGCLSGLVLFLDNEDKDVVKTALEALNFLADYQPNCSQMRDEIGMVISLKAIINKEEIGLPLRKMAKQVYNKIIARPINKVSSKSGPKGQKHFFLGESNKKAKLVTMQIRGLTTVTRRLCEEHMVKTKGVISFTFDLKRSRIIVRCKPELSPESLCEVINQTKLLTAQQVVKNEKGEEAMLSFGTAPSCNVEKSSGVDHTLPDYLPEDEDMPQVSDKAISRMGGDDKENSGWFGSVTNFISKSLYW